MFITMNSIARRLREFRLNENRNQEGVAKVAGMAQSAWAGWERNPPKALQSLVDLSVYYGVSVDYLLGITDIAAPRVVRLDEVTEQLMLAARKLPPRRRDDLLAIAKAYLEIHEKTPRDDQHLMKDIQNLIGEYGGSDRLRGLIDLLNSLDGDGLLDNGGEEPPQRDD